MDVYIQLGRLYLSLDLPIEARLMQTAVTVDKSNS